MSNLISCYGIITLVCMYTWLKTHIKDNFLGCKKASMGNPPLNACFSSCQNLCKMIIPFSCSWQKYSWVSNTSAFQICHLSLGWHFLILWKRSSYSIIFQSRTLCNISFKLEDYILQKGSNVRFHVPMTYSCFDIVPVSFPCSHLVLMSFQ